MGLLDEATEYYKKTRDKKEIPFLYNLWAEVYKENDNKSELEKTVKEGIKWYKKEIENKKEDGVNYVGLSLLYGMFTQNLTEAEQLAKKAIELKPDHQSYYALGVYYQKTKNYNEAVKYLKIALEKNQSFTSGFFALSKCYRALGMFAEAKKTCKKALSINPKNRFIISELEKVNKKSSVVD